MRAVIDPTSDHHIVTVALKAFEKVMSDLKDIRRLLEEGKSDIALARVNEVFERRIAWERRDK